MCLIIAPLHVFITQAANHHHDIIIKNRFDYLIQHFKEYVFLRKKHFEFSLKMKNRGARFCGDSTEKKERLFTFCLYL